MSGRRSSVYQPRATTLWAAVGTILLTVLLSTLTWPAVASATPNYVGLRGTDRYETAIKISEAGYQPGVEAVVLATGEDFPDALSAGPLAAAYGGPVLLTRGDMLDEATRAEIARLQPQKIFAVGLELEVINEVCAAFPELAEISDGIVRLVGLNRYDTARLVADQVRQRLGGVSAVVLAPGDSFADALSVGPLADAKGWPILLTPATGPLPAETAAALADLQPKTMVAVGTTVDPAIPGMAVERFVGVDRYDTCAQVISYAVGQGLSYTRLGFVTGTMFPDGLAAGPYLARDEGMLVLTANGVLPASLARTIMEHAGEVQSATFIGLEPTATMLLKGLFSVEDLPEGFTFATLAQGARGIEVRWLEQRLVALTYRPGPVDGVFDQRTYQAVLAFQKWEGLSRDGIVGARVWQRLLSADAPSAAKSGSGAWLEISKSKQVLLYVKDGSVARTLAVSTGSAGVGIITPTGTYKITRRSGDWDGPRYKPLYLRTWGVLAIHGYPSVPAWPASHGCVRVPLWDQDELYPLIPVGTKVYIY